MRFKVAFLVLVFILFPFLGGCWDYRGANEIDIVTGLAIDKDEETGLYKLTVEIVDLDAALEKNSVATKYVEIEGKNLLEASRNSKRKLVNELFLADMEIVIISSSIAETEGIFNVLEALVRHPEPRETLLIAIAQEVSAKDILLSKGMDTSIVSYGIARIIKEDYKITASTISMEVYKVYNVLKEEGDSLVLPVVHCVQNNEDTVIESNGLAVFKEDKLIGYLTPEESRNYLFINNKVGGGAITFKLEDFDNYDCGFAIRRSATQKSFSYENEQLKIIININTRLNLAELKPGVDLSDSNSRKTLEREAETFIEKSVSDIIKKVKSEYKYDIFGFGNLVYKKNPRLWEKLKDDWEKIFLSTEFEVNSKVYFVNTGIIQNY